MADFVLLESLLDQGHTALMGGDLSALETLAEEIEAALSAPGNCDPAQARRLSMLAQRNAGLLDASLNGIRAARRRARELTDQGRFSTYDVGGQRGQPGLPGTAAARRL